MRELLSADWYMLRKNGTIWWLLLFTLCIGALILVADIFTAIDDYPLDFENTQITLASILVGAASALLCGTALDNAFSEGTIRNKVITGRSRAQIYWASYLTYTLAAILLYICYAALVLVGQLAIAPPPDDPAETATMILYAMCPIPGYTALYCAVGMIGGRKGVGVACLVAFVALFAVGVGLQQSLMEPETLPVYDWEEQIDQPVDDDVEPGTVNIETAGMMPRVVDTIPNPSYVAEPARSVCQFFFDFTPTGQSLQLVTEADSVLPWYSLGFCVIFISIGAIVMLRRNIS